ncbi:glycosyltransferase family 2 protein [Rhabdobacter roseus]|uniref:Glycosyltransferase involved in cell wall biosynthesis n=2 Tax=Rhabdobacter roseus TaxID=1655419 RepID=A0A840TQH2_9BACT|nr:glycosyltransferase involved in cell wall biosynthesis [Rhabdobacter roseus]
MNKLFVEYVQRYTYYEYELIVIDNASTDGSTEFFKSTGATVIRNETNYSYPHCQNQGLSVAKGQLIAFLNNDLIVSPNWDQKLLDVMQRQGYDFLSPASNDRAESDKKTRTLRNRWRLIKNPLLTLFGPRRAVLLGMFKLMYRNWEAYQDQRTTHFAGKVKEGFSGSCIVATKQGLEKIGTYWDERIQRADFDFYLRTKKRALTEKDVKPLHLALEVYFHHFSRLTLKSKHYVPFTDAANLITEDEKWGSEKKELIADIEY